MSLPSNPFTVTLEKKNLPENSQRWSMWENPIFQSPACRSRMFTKICSRMMFLVGGFNPSEKSKSQLGWLFPIYGKIMKNKKCSKPPTSPYFHMQTSIILCLSHLRGCRACAESDRTCALAVVVSAISDAGFLPSWPWKMAGEDSKLYHVYTMFHHPKLWF